MDQELRDDMMHNEVLQEYDHSAGQQVHISGPNSAVFFLPGFGSDRNSHRLEQTDQPQEQRFEQSSDYSPPQTEQRAAHSPRHGFTYEDEDDYKRKKEVCVCVCICV